MEPFRRAGRKGLHVKIKRGPDRYDIVSVGEVTIREARRLRDELQERADLESAGLVGSAVTAEWFKRATLGDLCRWWLEEISPTHAGHAESVSALGVLVLGNRAAREIAIATGVKVGPELEERAPTELCDVKLRELTAPYLVRFFAAMAKDSGYSARSINGFRDRLRSIINTAVGHGRWVGANPASSVKALPVSEAVPEFVRAHEVQPLLEAAEGVWRDIFAVGIYTAMRMGEIFGLQKCDVDLESGYITVRRSHARDRVKGRRSAVVPIAAGLRPYLESAMARSGASPLLFPAGDGGLMHRKTNSTRQLKSALARAGLTLGYSHVCRKKGCQHREQAEDSSLRRCPAHGMKLWPVAKARPLHFHQLRHTTATLLLLEGVPLAAVSKILRHASVEITLKTYGHLTPEYLKGEIAALDAAIGRNSQAHFAAEPGAQALRGSVNAALGMVGQWGAAGGRVGAGTGDKSGDNRVFAAVSSSGQVTNLEQYRGVKKVEPTGVEPVPSALRNRPTGLGSPGQQAQTTGNPAFTPGADSRQSPVLGRFGQGTGDKSGDSVSPRKSGGGVLGNFAHQPVTQGVTRYYTVAQAASVLGVNPALIYALCEREEMPHRRVGNAIRIPDFAVEGLAEGEVTP